MPHGLCAETIHLDVGLDDSFWCRVEDNVATAIHLAPDED